MALETADKKKLAEDRAAKRLDQRRKQIFEAAGRVFALKGFHNATVQDVADEAGLGKGTLYEYVQSKNELLLLVIDEGQHILMEQLHSVLSGITDPAEKLRAMVREALRLIEEHRDAARVIIPIAVGMTDEAAARIDEIRERYIEVFQQVIDDGVSAGAFRPMNTATISELILESCHHWVLSDTLVRNSGGPEAYSDQLCELFFEGILRRERPAEKE